MREDPIVAEIHRFREQHARRFNYDIHAICDDIRKRQAKRKNLSPLKPVTPTVMKVAEAHPRYRTGESKQS